MANFYGTGRSNYFKVKDLDKFKQLLSDADCQLLIQRGKSLDEITEEDPVGFAARSEGGEPYLHDEETDEQIDFFDVLPQHLQNGEVAVYLSVGQEKIRYVEGWAIALNSKGEKEMVSLDDIYFKADELAEEGKEVSRAEC
jgi:hypothetical protein